MNKLDLTQLGGDPLALDDLEFLQNALAEAIKGLASVWQSGSSDSILISGFSTTISGPNTIWTGGYIVVNSEVYYVSGGTFPTGSYLGIDISQTTDSNGDETFEDLSTHSTYLIRRGVLQVLTGGPNEIDIADFITIKDRLPALGAVVNNETPWLALPTLGATWSAPGTFLTVANSCGYRKNKLGDVELKGVLSTTLPASSVTLTLPVGFRPNSIKIFVINAFNSLANLNTGCQAIVWPNGELKIYLQSGASGDVSLEGIRFSI